MQGRCLRRPMAPGKTRRRTNKQSPVKDPIFQQSQLLWPQPMPLIGRFGAVKQFEDIGQHRAVVAVIRVAYQARVDGRDVHGIDAPHHDQLAAAVAGAADIRGLFSI